MTVIHTMLLYLLSLHAVTHALMAMGVHYPVGLIAGGLAIAAMLGHHLHGVLGDLLDIRNRWKVFLIIWFLYGGYLVLLIGKIQLGHTREISEAIIHFAVLQALFFICAGVSRGFMSVKQNAFVLLATSVLAGGTIATTAIAGYAAWMVLWLTLDHSLRKGVSLLTAWRSAIPMALLAASLCVAVFHYVPPTAFEPVERLSRDGGGPLSSGELTHLYYQLLGVGVGAVVLMFLISWYYNRGIKKSKNVVLEEIVPTRNRQSEIAAGTVRLTPEDVAGWRGKVVKLYVEFLAKAKRRGVRRRPDKTPHEFAGMLPDSGKDLTEIFSRARYGGLAITQDDYKKAAQASSETLDQLGS